jgi:hypothetical protein
MEQEENKEMVMYAYRNSEGKLLWTSNLDFAQLRADSYGTFKVYEEKTKIKKKFTKYLTKQNKCRNFVKHFRSGRHHIKIGRMSTLPKPEKKTKKDLTD